MTTLTMKHAGELKLRRILAEEALDAATVEHVRHCNECGARLAKLKEEQRVFEAEVPFDRFAAGVEKEARHQKASSKRSRLGVLVALAACVIAFFVGTIGSGQGVSRLKGGASVDFVIAGPGGQRPAQELEQLANGERVRIGVSGTRHVLALSIDDAGEVSTVYAETLTGEGQTWLPDSLEFTGQGREHLIVLLSDAPISAPEVTQQLREHFEAAGGDLSKLKALEVSGVQVHRTFLKP